MAPTWAGPGLLYLTFRSRKNFLTTYAIVPFLSPDLSMKVSNFSKTVVTIFKKIAVIMHRNVLLSVQWYRNRMTGM